MRREEMIRHGLEDQEYLNELNQTLEEKSSYLIVRKDKELIYIGEDASISLLTQLPSYGDTVKDEDAGTYIDGDEQVLIKQITSQFVDGVTEVPLLLRS